MLARHVKPAMGRSLGCAGITDHNRTLLAY
jgi:hypothetical protein